MPLVDTIETFQMTNVGTHIDGTDVYQSNRNLLDNAYFVGGGSQLGDGVFPINQRGSTFYASQSTGIDRWKSDSPWGAIANVALQTEGLVIAGNTEPSYPTSFVRLSQVLATPPVGKTVTLSILTDIVSPDSEGNYPHIWCGGSVAQAVTSPGLTSVTFTWPSTENSVCIVVDNGATSAASLRIQAIKLEEGSVSTIQNDAPPDFGEELRKCKRYLRRIKAETAYGLFGVGAVNSATIAYIDIPIDMRTTPTGGSVSGAFRLVGSSFWPNVVVAYDQSVSNTHDARFNITGSGLTAGQAVILTAYNDAAAYIELTCEL